MRRHPLALLATIFLGALTLLAFCPCAWAQFVDEDDTLKDHAAQDEAYLERTRKQAQPPGNATSPEEAKAEFLRRANELIRDQNFQAAGNERFQIRTDDPRLDPDAVLALLDDFNSYFDQVWQPLWPNYQTDIETTPVFLFYSFAKYNQLLDGDYSRSIGRPKGHYADLLGAIAMHSDADTVGDLPDTLVHELAHRLAARKLAIHAGTAPIWVEEGLASYFGFTFRNKNGEFQPGRVGGKNLAILRNTASGKPQESIARLQRFRRLLRLSVRKNESLIENTVRIQAPADFYSGDSELNYSTGWIVIHYMLHGESGALRQPFLSWLAGGEPDADGFYAAIGILPADLEARILDYAGKL